MGIIYKRIDKLPTWAKLILTAFGAVASAYCITHDGFWKFLLRVIFAPEL